MNIKILSWKNQGKGAAVKLGFSKATGDFIIIHGADLEYNPDEYFEIIKHIINGKADVVYRIRFIDNKPHRVLYFWHYIGNKFLKFYKCIYKFESNWYRSLLQGV